MINKQQQTCTVLGAGTMGCQIAFSLAVAGFPTRLWARRREALAQAQETLATYFEFYVSQGLADAPDKQQVLDLLSYHHTMESALDGCDVVIEAIAEDLQLKQSLLANAEQLCPKNALISSTTSALRATDIQSALTRPENFCVAHYIQPAHLMEVVEVVPGEKTAEQTTNQLTKLLENCGKAPVTCPDIPGFLFARIQHVILREFADLQAKGLVSAQACDTIMRKGYAARLPAMGPFEHADLAGLDLLNSDGAKAVWADLCNHSDPANSSVGALYAQGHTGMRSGQGYYNWQERDAEAFKQHRDKVIVESLKKEKH
ncbi:3-hydroxyacyl-CoA dehydrogenase family protein [Polycladidibacter hongkongensis]|uniref:3-hydroxyacyl-CoA dehydrogenase family protein n=1 Tax=Polycladidibacter hongkongensis TaxID=1647556 RepID=UPI00083550ED|nr:3-hydroxyacyl-CoA dehydrogenase family protein [Pseudovibrio hongkongensis]